MICKIKKASRGSRPSDLIEKYDLSLLWSCRECWSTTNRTFAATSTLCNNVSYIRWKLDQTLSKGMFEPNETMCNRWMRQTISDTNLFWTRWKIWMLSRLIGRTINRALAVYICLHVTNIYVYICIYVECTYEENDSLITHTERYQRAAYRAEGFPSGNEFPARNRVSCPNKLGLPFRLRDFFTNAYLTTYLSTIVP